LRRDDRDSNAFLLLRHTGMRIGECADLSWDCLRRIGHDSWAIHVPLGKLKTERLVPVDSFVCRLVDRLRRLRSQDPLPADGFLLARPSGRSALIRKLRTSWRGFVATVGITTRIVPHQLRHSFGTEMLRAGVSLPAVMKLLGHLKPEMTMRYVEVSLLDLQREFHLARSQPRHLLPASRRPSSISSPQATLASLRDSLHVAQHVLEMFRRTLSQGPDSRLLDRLANRLTKITSETRKLGQG
jgi:integrase